jgi:tight adherence protein C
MIATLAVASAVLTGLAILLLVVGATEVLRRRALHARLVAFTEGVAADSTPPATQPTGLPVLNAPGRWLARVIGEGAVARRRLQLERAGRPGGLTADQLLGLRALAVLAGLGLAALFLGTHRDALGLLEAALALGLSLFGLDLWLRAAAMRRAQRIERELPTLVDLLQLCLGAGMGFDNAIETISERMQGPLAEELRRYVGEVSRLGVPRREALAAVARRVNSSEMALFVDAVIQATEVGTGLLTVIGAQARLLRQQRRRQAEAAARRAPVRMIIPMTLFILPVLILVVLGPAMLRFAGSYGATVR